MKIDFRNFFKKNFSINSITVYFSRYLQVERRRLNSLKIKLLIEEKNKALFEKRRAVLLREELLNDWRDALKLPKSDYQKINKCLKLIKCAEEDLKIGDKRFHAGETIKKLSKILEKTLIEEKKLKKNPNDSKLHGRKILKLIIANKPDRYDIVNGFENLVKDEIFNENSNILKYLSSGNLSIKVLNEIQNLLNEVGNDLRIEDIGILKDALNEEIVLYKKITTDYLSFEEIDDIKQEYLEQIQEFLDEHSLCQQYAFRQASYTWWKFWKWRSTWRNWRPIYLYRRPKNERFCSRILEKSKRRVSYEKNIQHSLDWQNMLKDIIAEREQFFEPASKKNVNKSLHFSNRQALNKILRKLRYAFIIEDTLLEKYSDEMKDFENQKNLAYFELEYAQKMQSFSCGYDVSSIDRNSENLGEVCDKLELVEKKLKILHFFMEDSKILDIFDYNYMGEKFIEKDIRELCIEKEKVFKYKSNLFLWKQKHWKQKQDLQDKRRNVIREIEEKLLKGLEASLPFTEDACVFCEKIYFKHELFNLSSIKDYSAEDAQERFAWEKLEQLQKYR